jgi:hypothetical protein
MIFIEHRLWEKRKKKTKTRERIDYNNQVIISIKLVINKYC